MLYIKNYLPAIIVLLYCTSLIAIQIERDKFSCNKLENDFCFLSKDKECSQLVVQPSSCILNSTKCQLVFDWIFNNDSIEFNLNIFDFKPNQWNGILFSIDNKQKLDLVIALIPENGTYKLINGDLSNGSITILNYNINNTQKQINHILNSSIRLVDNSYIEIKFSRYQFSTCGNMFVYLLNGSLALDGNILYEKQTLPEPLGLFCFSSNECDSNFTYSAIKSDLLSLITTTINNNESNETTNILETNSTFIYNTTSIVTTTIEIIPTTTNPLKMSGCLIDSTDLGNGTLFQYNYLNDSDRVEFYFTFNVEKPIKFAIFITFDNVFTNQVFLLYGEKNNPNDQSLILYSNITSKILEKDYFVNDEYEAIITFSLPSLYKLSSSQIEMRNVYYFKIYTNPQASNRNDFFKKINSSLLTETQNIHIGSCVQIPKNYVQLYVRIEIENLEWLNDYLDYESNKTISLLNNITLILEDAFSSSIYQYSISNVTILVLEPNFNKRKRDLTESSITLTISFYVQSSVSKEATKSNVDRILQMYSQTDLSQMRISFHLKNINRFEIGLTPPIDNKQSHHTVQFGFVLSLNFIATIIVLLTPEF